MLQVVVAETYRNMVSNSEGDSPLRREAGTQRPSEGTTKDFGESQRKQEIHAGTTGELIEGTVTLVKLKETPVQEVSKNLCSIISALNYTMESTIWGR